MIYLKKLIIVFLPTFAKLNCYVNVINIGRAFNLHISQEPNRKTHYILWKPLLLTAFQLLFNSHSILFFFQAHFVMICSPTRRRLTRHMVHPDGPLDVTLRCCCFGWHVAFYNMRMKLGIRIKCQESKFITHFICDAVSFSYYKYSNQELCVFMSLSLSLWMHLNTQKRYLKNIVCRVGNVFVFYI